MTKEHPVICNSLNRNSVYSVHVNAFFYTGRHHLFKKILGNTSHWQHLIIANYMMSPNKHSKPNQCVMYCVRFPESERQMATPL